MLYRQNTLDRMEIPFSQYKLSKGSVNPLIKYAVLGFDSCRFGMQLDALKETKTTHQSQKETLEQKFQRWLSSFIEGIKYFFRNSCSFSWFFKLKSHTGGTQTLSEKDRQKLKQISGKFEAGIYVNTRTNIVDYRVSRLTDSGNVYHCETGKDVFTGIPFSENSASDFIKNHGLILKTDILNRLWLRIDLPSGRTDYQNRSIKNSFVFVSANNHLTKEQKAVLKAYLLTDSAKLRETTPKSNPFMEMVKIKKSSEENLIDYQINKTEFLKTLESWAKEIKQDGDKTICKARQKIYESLINKDNNEEGLTKNLNQGILFVSDNMGNKSTETEKILKEGYGYQNVLLG